MTPDAAEQSVCSCVHVLAALGLADGSAAPHASTEPVADVEDVGRSFADDPGAATDCYRHDNGCGATCLDRFMDSAHALPVR